MSAIILRGESQAITLRVDQVDCLLKAANSDAALLYLALVRASGVVTPESLQAQLKWSALRLDNAESALQDMGLVERPQQKEISPTEERTEYTTEELSDIMSKDEEFKMMVHQIEKQWGKRITIDEIRWLANLYHDQGMSVDVIYLLVNHCVAERERTHGENKKPTFRAIWKEGNFWVNKGVTTHEQAVEYLRKYAEKRGNLKDYMKVLQLGDRPPAPAEETFILDWMEKGFSPDVVAIAYDKTMIYKKELNWNYLNGILKRWDKEGWHTVAQVKAGDAKKPTEKNSGRRTESKKPRGWDWN